MIVTDRDSLLKYQREEDEKLNREQVEETPGRVLHITHHCGDPYQGCCLPYKTPVMPNGWCTCICGDCRLAKYQAQEKLNARENT